MIAALWALGAASAAPVADHRGEIEGTRIVWDSVVVAPVGKRLPVAVELPRDQVTGLVGASPTWEADRLVAITPDAPTVEIASWQGAGEPLRPPLVVSSEILQQISVVRQRLDEQDARDQGWILHVGWIGSPDVGVRDRLAARTSLRRAGRRLEVGSALLRVEQPTGGFAIRLSPRGRVSFGILAAAVASTGLVLGGLLWAHRRLERGARRERIDAYFARGG